MITNFLSILFVATFLNRNVYSTSENRKLSIEIKRDGKTIKQDLIEFIFERMDDLNKTSSIQNKAIMVLGMTGTGKSTLVNYLNGLSLVCAKKNMRWVLELENDNSSFSNEFAKIGNNVHSQTFLPAGYTPQGKDFTYIDNPGFKDTNGLPIEILNGYFREKITLNVNDLKFLLLLTDNDLRNGKGNEFRESIKAFSNFIGAFDYDFNGLGPDDLSKSIGLVITKVDNDGETDHEVRKFFVGKLSEILLDEENNKKLSVKEYFVFSKIIENLQIEIFSNPKKVGPIGFHQKVAIDELIARIKYVKKAKLNIRVKISEVYKSELRQYTHYHFDLFEKNFNQIIFKAIQDFDNKSKYSTVDTAFHSTERTSSIWL